MASEAELRVELERDRALLVCSVTRRPPIPASGGAHFMSLVVSSYQIRVFFRLSDANAPDYGPLAWLCTWPDRPIW
jgi:hypothetical protein